jgi:hypothetical protein
VVQAVLGLGRLVVDGGETFRFGPRHPEASIAMSTPRLALKASQREFYAIDLTLPWDSSPSFDGNQRLFPLTQAREDGTFAPVGSVYDVQNDLVTESTTLDGPLLVTFNNLIKHRALPLPEALDELLQLLTRGMGTAVEVELAGDLGDFGARRRRGQPTREPVLYILQVRPILVRERGREIDPGSVAVERLVCRSDRSLGVGEFAGIRDIIYVKPETFDPALSPKIAKDVGAANARLAKSRVPYVLIGPGRWGSSDHWLGIPVAWSQISGARLIVEASPRGYNVEPSQGSHFFHNITAFRLGYFTIPPGSTREEPRDGGFLDWGWLSTQPIVGETEHLRHVRADSPLAIHVDGRSGLGLIAWCEAELEGTCLD